MASLHSSSTSNFVGRLLRLAGVLALAAAPARAQSGDTERNFTNVQPPLYAFGARGEAAGKLGQASGLAIDKDDLLYVADAGNHRVQKFTMNGLARGSFGACGTGPGEFVFPSAVAVAPDGPVFVVDALGRLQSFAADGHFLKSWDGLRAPRGVAATADRVYVTEGDLNRIRVLSRTGSGDGVLGGPGSLPGHFLSPAGVAVDEEGFLYVADSGNHRIQKLDAAGKPLAEWGAWGSQAGQLSHPAGLGYAEGRVYVADYANHRIQVFDKTGTFVKQWGAPPSIIGAGDGRLHYPEGLAVSPSGGLTVVSEPVENRIQVFANRSLAKIERVNDLPWWDSLHARLHAVRLAPPPPGCKPQTPGVLATADVHAVFFFDVTSNALGPIAAAGGYGRKLGELNGVSGVAVDPDRARIFVGDPGNRRLVTFEIPRSRERPELFGNTIRVVGSQAFERLVTSPQVGYAPESALPGPMCRGDDGRLYILDRANAALLVCDANLKFQRRLPVSPTLLDFCVASDGTIYGTDPACFLVRIYDVDGREKSPWNARSGKAGETFRLPWGVALDDKGFVYIADTLEDAVLKFDREGRFLRRWGTPGPYPDRLSAPRHLTFHKPDRLIVEDYGNHRAQLCNTEGEFLGSYVAGGLATPITIR